MFSSQQSAVLNHREFQTKLAEIILIWHFLKPKRRFHVVSKHCRWNASSSFGFSAWFKNRVKVKKTTLYYCFSWGQVFKYLFLSRLQLKYVATLLTAMIASIRLAACLRAMKIIYNFFSEDLMFYSTVGACPAADGTSFTEKWNVKPKFSFCCIVCLVTSYGQVPKTKVCWPRLLLLSPKTPYVASAC